MSDWRCRRCFPDTGDHLLLRPCVPLHVKLWSLASAHGTRQLSQGRGTNERALHTWQAADSTITVVSPPVNREAGRPAQCLKPEMFHVWREGLDMYVTDVGASSESLSTFDVFVLDAGDTLYVWGGEQCSQLEVEMATFFAEHRKSVRNSDVEVSHTPDVKFWMLLFLEIEIDDVRCVRNRSASTKLWGDTIIDTVPERDLVAERAARNMRRSSRKAERARAREQKKAARVTRVSSCPPLRTNHTSFSGMCRVSVRMGPHIL